MPDLALWVYLQNYIEKHFLIILDVIIEAVINGDKHICLVWTPVKMNARFNDKSDKRL